MAAAKHSPGPWWATDYGIRNAGGYICALVHPTKYEGQDERYAAEKAEREGDARLLAAAAALAEALRPFAKFACDTPHVGEPICHNCAARAALALVDGA